MNEPTTPPTAHVPRGRRGIYAQRIFPRILDVVMDTAETRRVRAEVCAPLAGEVLEIGFGTGHNLPFLPRAVTRLLAVDPLARGRELAAARIAASPIDVQFVGLDGEHLPLPDESVGSVLCTWTLCSVADPAKAIAEIARVLEPGGALHFVEHGLAPDERVQRWQRRLDGVQQRIACGCHLDRDVVPLLEAAGLRPEGITRRYAPGEPKILGWTTQGRAVRPHSPAGGVPRAGVG